MRGGGILTEGRGEDILLEQNVFNITSLSFDDNNVLKMSIGYTNICSNVQDHRQKVISL